MRQTDMIYYLFDTLTNYCGIRCRTFYLAVLPERFLSKNSLLTILKLILDRNGKETWIFFAIGVLTFVFLCVGAVELHVRYHAGDVVQSFDLVLAWNGTPLA